MIEGGNTDPDDAARRSPDLRIGIPERESAVEALEAHLVAQRLTPAEYDRRVEATGLAHTRAQLLRIFDDLPAPRPELPPAEASPADPDDDEIPALAVTGCLTVGLGMPVAIVFGFVYGAWWTLAVPAVVTVAMTYLEHLRTPPRGPVSKDD